MPELNLQISDPRFSDIENRLKKMSERADEFCQSRTAFQIEKFIACEEYSDISKFRHLSHNSHVTMQEVRREMLSRERLVRKLKSIQDSTETDNDITIYELNLQLEEIERRIKGLLKEVNIMENICDELEKKNGKPFTMQQLEDEEPEYWRRRFASQMHCAQTGGLLGVGEGNYHSYLMALESPILPTSKNQINPINIGSQNELATTALENKEGVRQAMLVQMTPEEYNRRLEAAKEQVKT